MKQVKAGDRVVYCHKDGGFNALVIEGNGGSSKGRINLIFIHPTEGEITLQSVPNVQHAKVEKEVPKLIGPKGKKKLGTVKRMVLKAHGYWRP